MSFFGRTVWQDEILKNIARDIRWAAEDKANNKAIDQMVKDKFILEKNKTNAVIVSDVIYPKGTYIELDKILRNKK